jgi:hypothetical protein
MPPPRGLDPVDVEGQPLAANAGRLLDALQFLGAPLPEKTAAAVREAAKARDARTIQELLDPQVLVLRSSWVALRQFPQLHTNPVNVLVEGKPIRASRKSALWCIGTIEQLWRVRGSGIAAPERAEAEKTFQIAIEKYRRIAAEAPEGS